MSESYYRPLEPSEFRDLEAARRVLTTNRTRLPYVVEFSGLPKAGKTTILRRTSRALATLGIRNTVCTEAATEKVGRDMRSNLFVFNLLCCLENIRSILTELQRKDDVDVLLVDRGLMDSMVWIDFVSKVNLLAADHRLTIRDFITLPQWFNRLSLIVYVKNDWRSYQARYLLDSPIEQSPEFVNERFRLLHDCYIEAIGNISRVAAPGLLDVLEIDGALPQGISAESVAAPDVLRANWSVANDASKAIVTAILRGIIESNSERVAVIPAERFVPEGEHVVQQEDLDQFVLAIFGRDRNGQKRRVDVGGRSHGELQVKYVDRASAEANPSYLQLVAGAFVRRHDRIMVLRHSEAERRQQLVGKRSILVTGHVEEADARLATRGRNEVEHCLWRELDEELVHLDMPVVKPLCVLRMGDDEMGRRHLGIIYEVHTHSMRLGVSMSPGAGKFEQDVEWWSIHDLRSAVLEFNEWSRKVIMKL